MRIYLITVSSRVPAWVDAGFQEYAKRLAPVCPLHLVQIPPTRRSATAGIKRFRQTEAKRIHAAIPAGAWVVALDEKGQRWSSVELARQLEGWMQRSSDLALLVGGADGLDQGCIEQADQLWSLSPLTFPHALIRVIVAEQLYRAWSLLNHHPYHRR